MKIHYNRYGVRVANDMYVSEMTRTPGHVNVVNIPIYYGD